MNPSASSALPAPIPAGMDTPPPASTRFRLFPVTRLSARTMVATPLLGFALVGPSMLVSTLLPFSITDGQRLAAVATTPIAMMLQHVLMGPALEELLFRGLVLQLCRRVFPAWLAVAISAAAFGALHVTIGPTAQLIATLAGLVLGWLALSRGSLYASFICHATFNFTIAFVVAPLFGVAAKVTALAQTPVHAPGMFEIVPAWWIGLSLAAAVAATLALIREKRAPSRG